MSSYHLLRDHTDLARSRRPTILTVMMNTLREIGINADLLHDPVGRGGRRQR